MPESRTVVVRLTPALKLRLVLLVILFVASLFAAYSLGMRGFGGIVGVPGEQSGSAREQQRQLKAQSQQIKSQAAEVVRLQKSAEIDRLAAEQVRQELFALRSESAELRKDVEFYKGLMAPSEREKGIKLHSFEIAYDELGDRYHYKTVMTNIGGRGQVVKGTMNIQLQGYSEGKQQSLSLSELPEFSGASPIKLRFRFFQNIEGSFKLSGGFEPTAIVASANVKDISGEPFRVSYNWQDLFAHDHSGGH